MTTQTQPTTHDSPPNPDILASVTLPARTFEAVIKAAAGFAEKGGNSPTLAGLCFVLDHDKEELRISAADGFKLQVLTIDQDDPPQLEKLLPAKKLVDAVLCTYRGVKESVLDHSNATLAFHDEYATFSLGDEEMTDNISVGYTRGNFPRYGEMFKEAEERTERSGHVAWGAGNLRPLLDAAILLDTSHVEQHNGDPTKAILYRYDGEPYGVEVSATALVMPMFIGKWAD